MLNFVDKREAASPTALRWADLDLARTSIRFGKESAKDAAYFAWRGRVFICGSVR